MRSDSVQSDQKSVQEETEEETESSQEKKLPGDWSWPALSVHMTCSTGQSGTKAALCNYFRH